MGHKSFLLIKERNWEFSEKSDGAEFNGLFIEAAFFFFFFVNLVHGVTGNISHSVFRFFGKEGKTFIKTTKES